MKRLVYTPKAYAWVKTDANGLINLSPYITAGSVQRKVNMVSSAEITIRNPKKRWTKGAYGKSGPVFHPMDPITIWLERIRGYPVQVFTGYLDQTPYLQLYPGTATLTASCTLKKLLHVYWDPALQYSRDFLVEYGWLPNDATGSIVNLAAESKDLTKAEKEEAKKEKEEREKEIEEETKALDDGSIGHLLFAMLKHIVEWDENAIHIEKLPEAIITDIVGIYERYNEDAKLIRKELEEFIKKYIGDGVYGGGGTSSGTGSPGNTNLVDGPRAKQVWVFFRDQGFTEEGTAGAMGSLWGESATFDPKVTEAGGGGGYGIAQWTSADRKNGLLRKPNHDTLEVQLNYIMEELPSQAPGLEAYLKKTQDHQAACTRWTNEYERPGIPRLSERLNAASQFFDKFKGTDASSSDREENTGGPRDERDQQPANRSASRGGGDSDNDDDEDKIFLPVDRQYIDYNNWGENRGDHLHDGEDFSAPGGSKIYAVKDGKVMEAGYNSGYGNYTRIQHNDGYVTGYAHQQKIFVNKGERVHGGQVIGKVNNTGHSFGDHLHFNVSKNYSGGSGYENNIAPETYLKGAAGSSESADAGGGGGGGGGGASWEDVLSTAKATAFVQDMEWPGVMETVEALTLSGPKSLMNDKPIFPFIEQLSQASMRHFQSLPNGAFYAFYPDYFGHQQHRKPYWDIYDIEILDGGIDITDEALATHVFCVGDTTPAGADPGISRFDRMATTGIVNIFNVVQSGFTPVDEELDSEEGDEPDDQGDGGGSRNQHDEESDRIKRLVANPQEAINFLQKYGARPHVEEAPFIRSPYFEAFMAHQTFNLMWSRMFLTQFQFTFMPELYPGGLVALPEHSLQLYIDSVTHTWDYAEGGFTTDAELSAPATLNSTKTTDDPLAFGLVRAAAKQ